MITLVSGINEVENYDVPPKSNKFFMDLTQNVFYVKDTNKEGISKIGVYRFQQEDLIYV